MRSRMHSAFGSLWRQRPPTEAPGAGSPALGAGQDCRVVVRRRGAERIPSCVSCDAGQGGIRCALSVRQKCPLMRTLRGGQDGIEETLCSKVGPSMRILRSEKRAWETRRPRKFASLRRYPARRLPRGNKGGLFVASFPVGCWSGRCVLWPCAASHGLEVLALCLGARLGVGGGRGRHGYPQNRYPGASCAWGVECPHGQIFGAGVFRPMSRPVG